MSSTLGRLLIRLVVPIPTLRVLLDCRTLALVYYASVALGGSRSYDSAQQKRDVYEKSDECAAKCPSTQRSGGQGTTTLTVDLKKTSGTFPVSYQMYSIPDELTIVYEGNTIFSTGGLVSGARTTQVTYSGSSTLVRVTINAPRSGTRWDVTVGCPP